MDDSLVSSHEQILNNLVLLDVLSQVLPERQQLLVDLVRVAAVVVVVPPFGNGGIDLAQGISEAGSDGLERGKNFLLGFDAGLGLEVLNCAMVRYGG